jgi:hypothetical protein
MFPFRLKEDFGETRTASAFALRGLVETASKAFKVMIDGKFNLLYTLVYLIHVKSTAKKAGFKSTIIPTGRPFDCILHIPHSGHHGHRLCLSCDTALLSRCRYGLGDGGRHRSGRHGLYLRVFQEANKGSLIDCRRTWFLEANGKCSRWAFSDSLPGKG